MHKADVQKTSVETEHDLFRGLQQELSWLHLHWKVYRQLFAKNEKRIELLNETGPLVFYVFQQLLMDETNLAICRLTDPPTTKDRENHGLPLLIDRVKGLNPDLASAGDYYSAPHIHRHKKLRIKITENQVEIFLKLERLALHPRSRSKNGRRIKIEAHFPPASQAYYEATPQKLLSQSRFIHPELNRLFVELFNADLYGNIRRCQGFLRRCTKEINLSGHELASERVAAAIASMRGYNRFRVPYFQALLDQARKQAVKPEAGREIVRRPGNPMLRYLAGDCTGESASAPSTSTQESLDL
jgi:AbiU2